MAGGILHPTSPLTAGLSFVPTEALASLAPGAGTPAEVLVMACAELRADFAFVPADSDGAADAVSALKEAGVAPFWAVDGPLWPVIEAYGVTEGLRATLTRSEEVAAAIDARMPSIHESLLAGIDLGARAIVIGEDLAGSEGLLVAPDFVIDVLMPRLASLVQAAAEKRTPVVLHSDGDIRALLTATARAGFSAVHTGGGLDFDGFERLYLAAHAEGLVVIGGLQTAALGRGAASATALGSRAGVLGKLGGLLLADDGGITEAMQVHALVSAMSAARDV